MPTETDWDEWLPYAIFTYNTTPHTATGYTLFELVYGHQATLPSALYNSPKLSYTYDDYAQELRERLRTTNRIARENLKEEKQKLKKYHDKKARGIEFKVEDKVLLHDETMRREWSKKLDSLWAGSYTVIEKNSDVNYILYTIKMGRRTLLTHINSLKSFINH